MTEMDGPSKMIGSGKVAFKKRLSNIWRTRKDLTS